jgi:hypothetical protein
MLMLEFFKRGQAARDVRLMAAQGVLDVRASELLSILVLLRHDADDEVRATAEATLARLPAKAVHAFLASAEVAPEVRAYFEQCSLAMPPTPGAEGDGPAAAGSAGPDDPGAALEQAVQPLAAGGDGPDASDDPELLEDEESKVNRVSILQKLAKMNFSERLKAANKGSREVRSILVRDPSKMIAMAVLSSPKLTEPEVTAFARMGNVSEDVLRTIGSNRAWMKNYNIVVALTKNAKTPLAMSLNLMQRLNDRDLSALSTDRNVPEPLRVAARKKVVSSVSR